MKRLFFLLIAAMFGCLSGSCFGQLTIATNREPQLIFGGRAKDISIIIHNTGGRIFDGELRAQVFQTTSATAIRLGRPVVNNFQVLPGQTVLDSVPLEFPTVKARTRFLVQWLVETNQVIGTAEVLVYPTNLLAELKPLSGGGPLGIFDPQNELKPLLQNLHLDFTDLENSDLENFPGKLAVIGQFQSRAQMREDLPEQIKTLAKKGAAVVWLQPPSLTKDEIKPSFYIVPEGRGAVVVVQPGMIAHLSENPRSQLNLIYFCKLALNPVPPSLPDLSTHQ